MTTFVKVLIGPPSRELEEREGAAYYVRSYLVMRTCVGVIGLALPLAFIVGEMYFLQLGFRVRDSISAYYHSQMRDLFVAGLCVTGFLLATYMSGHSRTREYWYSTVAGVAVLGVVFFPTWRPGVARGEPLCGAVPSPANCSPVEQLLGEAPTANIHNVCAFLFIVMLALMSFVFAEDELRAKNNPRMRRFHLICGSVILLGAVWAILGSLLRVHTNPLSPMYTGELMAIWAFGTSWLFKGVHIGSLLSRPTPPSA